MSEQSQPQPRSHYSDEDVIDRLYQIDQRLEDIRTNFLDAQQLLSEVHHDLRRLYLGPRQHSLEDVWSLLTSIDSQLHRLVHPEDPF